MTDTIESLQWQLSEITPRRHALLAEEDALTRELARVRAELDPHVTTDPELRVPLHARRKELERRLDQIAVEVTPLIAEKSKLDARLKLLRRAEELKTELVPAVAGAAEALINLDARTRDLVEATTTARLALDRVHRSAERAGRGGLNSHALGWSRVAGDLRFAVMGDELTRAALDLPARDGPAHGDHARHAADLEEWITALTNT